MKRLNDQSDHDLLIKLDQKVSDLQIAVKNLNDGIFVKISELEVRVRKLEDKTSNYKIAFALYSIAVGFMIALTLYHILSPAK